MTREDEVNSYGYKVAKASVDYSQKYAKDDELQGIVMDTFEDAAEFGYNLALERARALMTNQNPPAFDKHLIEMVFPELAESEDEKIRKTLIEYIKGIKSWNYFLGISKEQMIAWLEKQSEKKLGITHWMPMPEAPKKGGKK